MTTPAPAPSSLPPVAAAPASAAPAPPRQPVRVCVQCQATETPLWRVGPAGPKTLCNACGVRRSKALRKKQQAAAAAAAAAAGEPPPPTAAAKKKASSGGSSGAAAAGAKAAAAAKAAGGDASAAAAAAAAATARLSSAVLPRGPGGVAKKRRPRPSTDVVRAEVLVLDEARGGHAPAVIGHALLRRPAGAGLPSGGGRGLGGCGGGGGGGGSVAGGGGGEPPYGPTGGWQPPPRAKGLAHGWAQPDGAYGGGGHARADGRYAGSTFYDDPPRAYSRPYADLRAEPRLHLPRHGGEEPYPSSPAAAYAAHDGRPYYPPLAGPRAPVAGSPSPAVALSAAAAARSYTHVFGGRLPASAAAYGGAYPPPPRPGRRLDAEGDVDSGVTADEAAEEEGGARFRRSGVGCGGGGGGRVGSGGSSGGGSGGGGSGSRGREKQRGPHPPPPLWAAYPWPTGGAAAVAAADAKDDAGRPHEAVYWPRSAFAYQLRVPLGGERAADTDRLPERPPPLKSWPRKAAETQLANFNLLVAAASQAADRDFATTRTPPPPPGRLDVRSAHKPRAPRA